MIKENKKRIYIKLLDAPFIIKKFIKIKESNYEEYMLELINKFHYFNEKYGGNFCNPTSESSGECDANNEIFQLDFKLLANKSELCHLSENSLQRAKDDCGQILFGESKASKEPYRKKGDWFSLASFFGSTTLDELINIEKEKQWSGIKLSVESLIDILNILEKARTKKNLLYMLPYEFYIEGLKNEEEKRIFLTEGIEKNYLTLLEYRSLRTENKFETFVVLLYNKKFHLYRWDNKIEFLEYVDANEINNFNNLKSYQELLTGAPQQLFYEKRI